MADFGLYSALRGTDNWKQRRQDKAMNMKIVEQNALDAEAAQQQSMKAETEINKYFEDMQNLEVLPEDQERVKQIEQNSRASVVKGIAKYNGDLKRYMSSGGITDLGAYKNSVMKSQEVKQAMSNKTNLNAYLTDAAKGDRFFKKVDVEGKPMNFDEQMALFRAGKISKINYNGSEKAVTLDPFKFKSKPKDSTDPYSKNNVVTTSEIVFQAMQDGASEEQANAMADSYAERVRAGGETWKWGNKSEEERQIELAKAAKLRGGGSGGSGGTTTLNQRSPQLFGLAGSGRTTSTTMTPKERDWWVSSKGLNYDSKTNAYKPSYAIAGIDPVTDQSFDLSNALSVRPTNNYVTKNGEVYVQTDVIYDADSPGTNNPHTETLGWNQLANEDLRHSWTHGEADEFGLTEMDGKDVWSGQVLIPVTTEMKSGVYMDGMNKFMGHKSTQEGHAGSMDHGDYSAGFQQDYATLKQRYPNASDEAIMEAISLL